MTCDECEIRKRHVIEQSVEMASATIEHADKPWMARRRILQRLEHQYNQAVRNLHHHTDTHNRT